MLSLLGGSGLGLCPRLGGSPLPSGHPPVLPYRWASQASWPAEPAAFVAALKQLDMDAVREDLKLMFKTSQVWWPADYGNVCHTGLEHSTSRPHAALLRTVLRAAGVAQHGLLPHHRRPGRRRRRPPTLRARALGETPFEPGTRRSAVGGQHEPGQGPPPPRADQAEARAGALLGRPDRPRGQHRHREHGWARARLNPNPNPDLHLEPNPDPNPEPRPHH
eukprot:scaffold52646_cov54-Phaeocystis_antarctica.AAC.1